MRHGSGLWLRGPGVRLLLAVAAAGLGACTPWPEYATGGMAERHPTTSPAILVLEERCEAVGRAGGDRFLPGRMTDTRLLLQRARREVAGELTADSDQTLLRAEMLLSAIERDLASRRRRGGG